MQALKNLLDQVRQAFIKHYVKNIRKFSHPGFLWKGTWNIIKKLYNHHVRWWQFLPYPLDKEVDSTLLVIKPITFASLTVPKVTHQTFITISTCRILKQIHKWYSWLQLKCEVKMENEIAILHENYDIKESIKPPCEGKRVRKCLWRVEMRLQRN